MDIYYFEKYHHIILLRIDIIRNALFVQKYNGIKKLYEKIENKNKKIKKRSGGVDGEKKRRE